MDWNAANPPNEEKLIKYDVKPVRVCPDDAQYFFGYFDKSPWNKAGVLLSMRADFSHRQPRFGDVAELGTLENGKFTPFATTRAWCWQQGCMLQFFDEDTVIFNDFEGDGFVSRLCDYRSGRILRTYDRPIYCISNDRTYALSLDFARLDRERPGYGYTGVWHNNLMKGAPDDDGIWKMDLKTGESQLLISLRELRDATNGLGVYDNICWVNHLLCSADDKRFGFLFRWKRMNDNGFLGWHTVFYTLGADGKDLFKLSNEGLSSHYSWIDEKRIVCFVNRNAWGWQHYILTDKESIEEPLSPGKFWGDGHCTFSNDNKWMLSDSYPWPADRERRLYLRNNETGDVWMLGKFFDDPELPPPCRCDLHPRLSADNRTVCFDSVHEGKRGVYLIDVSKITCK